MPPLSTSRVDKGIRIAAQAEYDALLLCPPVAEPLNPKEFIPTKAQIVKLRRAEKNYKEGKLLSLDEFARRMGFAR